MIHSTHQFALLLLLVVCTPLTRVDAQVDYIESEVAGGANDTFAQAEDCRQIGNRFVIKGTVHTGNSNSDDEWYMFNGAAGACVDISFNITQAMGTGATYQLNVWLFDSTQTMIAAWNMTTAASSASFGIGTYTLPATDTYYIYVTEWSVAPNALAQPGISFTPLSFRGFAVTGATPDSTRNSAGGNQTAGSLYEITVGVSNGNQAQFDVWIDRDPNTGAFVCTPNPASVCAAAGGTTAVRFRASQNCPATGVSVAVAGGGIANVVPGATAMVNAPGPGVASSFTVDDGTGPQPCGQVQVLRTAVTWSGQSFADVQVCPGSSTCLDVCGPNIVAYQAALSGALGPPISFPPFLPAVELDTTDLLFNLTYPSNSLTGLTAGFIGQPGVDQICLNLPVGLVPVPTDVYLQVLGLDAASNPIGLSQAITLHLMP